LYYRIQVQIFPPLKRCYGIPSPSIFRNDLSGMLRKKHQHTSHHHRPHPHPTFNSKSINQTNPTSQKSSYQICKSKCHRNPHLYCRRSPVPYLHTQLPLSKIKMVTLTVAITIHHVLQLEAHLLSSYAIAVPRRRHRIPLLHVQPLPFTLKIMMRCRMLNHFNFY